MRLVGLKLKGTNAGVSRRACGSTARRRRSWHHAHTRPLSGFRPGDEEGSVEFRVLKDGKGLTTLSLQVTGLLPLSFWRGAARLLTCSPLETSSYPNDHSYICYALEDISPELLTVVEDIGSFPAKPLQDTLTRILKRFARALGGDDDEDEPESQAIDEDDSGSEAGVEGYDFDQLEYGAHGRGSEDPKVLAALKRYATHL